MLLTNNRAPLVADVATAPPNTVLEEATGYIDYICHSARGRETTHSQRRGFLLL